MCTKEKKNYFDASSAAFSRSLRLTLGLVEVALDAAGPDEEAAAVAGGWFGAAGETETTMFAYEEESERPRCFCRRLWAEIVSDGLADGEGIGGGRSDRSGWEEAADEDEENKSTLESSGGCEASCEYRERGDCGGSMGEDGRDAEEAGEGGGVAGCAFPLPSEPLSSLFSSLFCFFFFFFCGLCGAETTLSSMRRTEGMNGYACIRTRRNKWSDAGFQPVRKLPLSRSRLRRLAHLCMDVSVYRWSTIDGNELRSRNLESSPSLCCSWRDGLRMGGDGMFSATEATKLAGREGGSLTWTNSAGERVHASSTPTRCAHQRPSLPPQPQRARSRAPRAN